MKISLIFAADEKNAIGYNNDLPWPRMKADMKWFRQKTLGHHVIMGRKTYESMGSKPLPGRTNIVISRKTNYSLPGVIVAKSLGEGIETARDTGEQELFVAGGAQVLKQAIGLADMFYLTRIHGTFDADTWLEGFDEDDWKAVHTEPHAPDENNPYPYTFFVLERKG